MVGSPLAFGHESRYVSVFACKSTLASAQWSPSKLTGTRILLSVPSSRLDHRDTACTSYAVCDCVSFV